jgi:lipoyl(octanoyl) transferase
MSPQEPPPGSAVPIPGGSRVVEARWLGSIPYLQGVELQRDLVDRRRRGLVPDQLLLLEHPHVITMGSASNPEHVLAGPEERAALDLELAQSGRGGDVTYHGPGQLVGYPILDLGPDRQDIHQYLRDLEETLIIALGNWGVRGERIPGQTGVWTPEGKLAALGVRVSSRWITSHGFALNVNTDLGYFDTIIPCGIPGSRVTSVEALLGRRLQMAEVARVLVKAFGEVFQRTARLLDGLA